MKISAIICAAGRGERAGFGKNKLLTPLNGAPALFYTLEAFDLAFIDEVIVTSSPADFEEISALCAPFGYRVVLGGETRTLSVYNALKACTGDIVLIHDGARPYVTRQIIEGCIACVKDKGSGICAVPVTDTIAIADGGKICEVPDRTSLYSIQTPQGFFKATIEQAYELAVRDGKTYTDDSAVFRQYVGKPALCTGSPDNKKLTYKSDFAQEYPAVNGGEGQAIGIGVDVHAFGGERNFVTLCGVKIENDRGLIAHSDGDVPVHAVMDALLSAAGLKDIGNYFPDTDPAYAGADSIVLLKRVVELISRKGLAPLSVSVTIRAEKPRIAPHICAMQRNLAEALNIQTTRVGVSAGTCEKLGFVGQSLGIEAAAVALLACKPAAKQ